jgi:hypothetical protein
MFLFGKDDKGWFIGQGGTPEWRVKRPSICLSYFPDDPIKGTLLRFGDEDMVRRFFIKTQKLYEKNGLQEEVDALKCISFPPDFEVEELNKCIEITGYVGKVYEMVVGPENA